MGNTKANLTEEQVTEITLSSLKENPEGVTEYPILELMIVRCGCFLPAWRRRCATAKSSPVAVWVIAL